MTPQENQPSADVPEDVKRLARLRKLAEAAAKIAPGPWEAEGEETESGWGKHDEFVILDSNGVRLCGTENADTSFGSISEEHDGEGGHYQWNEPARVLMHFLAACDPATILTLFADRQAQEGARDGGGRVKALDWRPHGMPGTTARTPFGDYHIGEDLFLGGMWLERRKYPSEEAAKAAAQADYESRIRSAIEPSPVEGDRR